MKSKIKLTCEFFRCSLLRYQVSSPWKIDSRRIASSYLSSFKLFQAFNPSDPQNILPWNEINFLVIHNEHEKKTWKIWKIQKNIFQLLSITNCCIRNWLGFLIPVQKFMFKSKPFWLTENKYGDLRLLLHLWSVN